MADRVGQQLGDYRLIRSLGTGSFGEVYLGEHIYLQTQAAIKVLHARLEADELQGFLNEARRVATLKHAHIVQLLGFSVEKDTPFMVMQLAPRGTLLRRYPRKQRFPIETILPHVRQVAEGLQYAHDRKVIHMDIKPENMLLGEQDEVLLSDFGVAVVLQQTKSHLTVHGFSGTAVYAAPEQFQNQVGPASDQYALAVVVYEWLTSERPFSGDNMLAIGMAKAQQPPPPLRAKVPFLSPAVELVVLHALASEPKDRYPNVRAFAEALEQASKPPVVLPHQLPLPPDIAYMPTLAYQHPGAATPANVPGGNARATPAKGRSGDAARKESKAFSEQGYRFDWGFWIGMIIMIAVIVVLTLALFHVITIPFL